MKASGIRLYLQDGKLHYSAVKNSLSLELRETLKQHKAELVEWLKQNGGEFGQLPETRDIASKAPNNQVLSFAQQRLWFIEQFENGSYQYNMPSAFDLQGELDVSALSKALDTIVLRHEVLRTNILSVEGVAHLSLQNPQDPLLETSDFSALEAKEQSGKLHKLMTKFGLQPFDLNVDLLLRAHLVKLAERKHCLLFNMHHIATDGWSMQILLKEISVLYSTFKFGRDNPLQPLLRQYSDYANWQHDNLQGENLDQQLGYWKSKLADMPMLHSIPIDKPRPKVQTFEGAVHKQEFSAQTRQKLESLCKAQEVTPFVLLHSALSVIISKYSNEKDIIIGTPIAGRIHKDLEELVGLFVNTLVLRSEVSGTQNFAAFLAQNKQSILEAYSHQQVPFELVVEHIKPERNTSYHPLFQIMLTLQNFEEHQVQLDDLKMREMEQDIDIAKFDLELIVGLGENGINIRWKYNKAIFVADTIERMATSFGLLIEEVLSAPQKQINELSVVAQNDTDKLLREWNATEHDFSDQVGIHQLFEQQVEATPTKIALVFREQQVSYETLNAKANQLAQYLQQLGVTTDVPVGICMDRSIEMVVSILAIQKVGAAYLPLSPYDPESRRTYMLTNSGAGVVITQHQLADLTGTQSGINTVVIDSVEMMNLLSKLPAINPKIADLTSEHLAYVIYTSGSTGQPKGVAVPHRALVNRIEWMHDAYGLTSSDKVLQKTPYTFDVSVWEFFWPLIKGAELVMAEPEGHKDPMYLFDTIRALSITTLHFVPSMLRMMLQNSDWPKCTSVRQVFCSGESLPTELVEQFFAISNETRLHNLYGPTEAAIDVSYWDCSEIESTRRVLIGKPIHNTQLYCLDESMGLLPIGAAGELYIGGAGVARGYLNRPDLTKERFVANPFSEVAGARLYRTGDICRWNSEGQLEYLGRNDHQVKIRGFRIEPGEIENALQSLDVVQGAAVVARQGGSGMQLVGYVVGDETLSDEDLIGRCKFSLKATLPDYMVPSMFVRMKVMPLMTSGKLDRKALPVPQDSDRQSAEHVAPRNELEQQLCDIWADVLNLEQVGIEDNFFALGGDSIISIQLVSRAKHGGLHFTVRQLFDHQTVVELADCVSFTGVADVAQTPVEGALSLLPIQRAFFSRQLPAPDHYNQSVLLQCPPSFDMTALRVLVDGVYQRHDALRLRFTREQDVVSAKHVSYSEQMLSDSIGQYDISHLSGELQDATQLEYCQQAQASLDIEQGPVFKAVYFHRGAGDGRVLLVAHHLVIDGVSWRILLSDMEQGWSAIERGESPGVGLRSVSLQQWGAMLSEHVKSEQVQSQKGYWQERLSVPVPSLLEGGQSGDLQQLRFSLSEGQTRQLLGSGNHPYRTRTNELLMAGLLLAYRQWRGSDVMCLDVEGHGRELLGEALDIAETVGWFTSVYPLVLSCDAPDIGEVIQEVKEQYREVPDKGMGYGLLRYLDEDNALAGLELGQHDARIEFNYLGQFDNSLNPETGFSIADEPAGDSISKVNPVGVPLSINALVHQGRLRVDMTGHPRCQDIGPLSALFEQTLAECLAHCEKSEGHFTPSDFPLAKVDKRMLSQWQCDYPQLEKLYVATPMQSGLLFHGLLDGNGASYTIQIGCELAGKVDDEAMRRAWEALVARYDILRTAFVGLEGEQPHQLVQKTVELPFVVLDWRGLSEVEQESRLESLLKVDKAKGFDFGRAPLMRIHLARLGEERYRFVWTYHHALLDGWCTPILFGEVLGRYQDEVLGVESLTASPVVPYEQYIGWLSCQERQSAVDFWQEHLSGFVSPTPLLYDRVAESDIEVEVGYCRLSLGQDLTGQLAGLARAQHTTMNVVLQAAWSCLLQRYSNEQDIVFGSTISGRPAALSGVEQMIGLFINTIPVRVQVGEQMSFEDLLQVLHADNIARDEYGYLPLADIQQLSEVTRGTSLFDSLLVFENYPMDQTLNEAVAHHSSTLEISNVYAFEHTNYPLAIRAYVHQQQLQIELTYQPQHFTEENIERISQHLQRILCGMAESGAGTLVSQLSILSDVEQAQWLNTPAVSYPVALCLHQVFEQQVAQTPEKTALIFEGKKLSYQALNERANQLAHHLILLGVQPDSLVGLCVERSIDTVVATLAILKSGGAYVPMDPNYPQERLDYLLADSQVNILVTQADLEPYFIESGKQTVCLHNLQTEALLAGYSNSNPEVTGLTPEHMAYVIYTSGSTGQPKGVMVEHRNVVRLFDACHDNFEFNADDVWTLFHSNAFDFSVWEMWGALLHGSTVVVVPSQVAKDNVAFCRLINEYKVTVLSQTPSAFYPLMDYLCDRKDSLNLRYIVFGGEALEYRKLQNWFQNMQQSSVELVNMYGITETTVHVTYHAVNADDTEEYSSNIGQPLADLKAYVCSTKMLLQPVGVTGELYVSGGGVTRGYLNRPELTAERFIEHSFNHSKKLRLYRTGDLVRWNNKGELEYVGRIDNQVKIRGFRIELGEIESTVVAESSVKNAAVVAFENTHGDQQLAAYIVPSHQESQTPEYINQIKAFLISKLPQHMVPSYYYILDDLPLTSNGKLDRKALPQPTTNLLQQERFVAPSNDLEAYLCELWQEILELDKVGVKDNFFELGGHSLHAMRLVSQIRKTFNVDISLSAILMFPTINACAQEIFSLQSDGVAPQIFKATENVEIPLSFGQQRLWFVDQLQGGSTQYNISVAIKLEGNLQTELVEKVFTTIIQRHEVLRTCIVDQDGKATPIVKSEFELPIFWQDLTGVGSNEQQINLKAGMVADASEKYDLSVDLPVRLKVFKLTGEQFVFLFNTHHIASDGSSMQVLIDEFSALYSAYNKGFQDPLPPLAIQYGDFAYWQKNWLQGKTLESEMDFWKNQLEGIPSVHSLPLDKPRPAVQQFDGAFFNEVIDWQSSSQIADFCSAKGVTQFAFLQTAFALLMSRYSHQTDIVMSTAISGRTQSEIEPLIGFFVNDLVLRSDLSGNRGFIQLLDQNKSMLLEAFDHQHIPFQLLVEELQPERSMSHSPIAQIKFDFQESEEQSLDIEGLKLTYLKGENVGNIDYDLHLNVSFISGQFSLSWRYSSALFVKETIARMSSNFSTLLTNILAQPEQPIATLPILSASELQKVTAEFNKNDAHISESLCAHQLVEQVAERTPEKTAVYFDGEVLTYEELNEQANQVAHYLVSQGVTPDTLVALYVERSLDMIIGILGILKAGGAYVPIDPDLPDSRVKHILEDSGCKIVLTQADLMSNLPMSELKVLPIDENMREALLASQSVANIPAQERDLTSRNLAYVIYTSGSTGQPKGVMLEHQGVVNLAKSQNEMFNISADSNVLQFASISFDASVSEWVTTLSAGATLSILEDEKRYDIQSICEFVVAQNVTHATIPPALFHQERIGRAKSLQVLVFAGEKLTSGAIEKAQKCFPHAQFINAYGPTENTVCTSAEILNEALSSEFIGSPMNNVYCCVMDQGGNLCPIGAEGELLVGGIGLARGYVNQPELTQDKFINIDDVNIPYQRLYKTGDMVKWSADGKLIFVGRVDQQVKLRGFRIELEEISSVLSNHSQVDIGVVDLVEVKSGDKRLVAYCKPQNKVELWPSISEFFIYDYFAYRAMFTHFERNDLYRKALEKSVVNKTVLDIGPGPEAILSRLCLEAGAKHVYAVEILEETYSQAKQYLELAGLTDRITLIRGDIMEVELPEKADCCVSEIVGSIAGSEGSAVLIESARRLLKNPVNMIPVRSITRIAAATLDESQFDYGFSGLAYQYAERILNDFGKDFQYRISVKNVTDEIVISSRDVFEDLDYQNGSPFELEHDIILNINKKSTFNGLLVWMDLFVDHDLSLDILDDPASWLPVYFPVSCAGIAVDIGDRVEATITRKLCDNGVNPDFHVEGKLIRSNDEEFSFKFDSYHHALSEIESPFHQKLFDEHGKLNKLEDFGVTQLKRYLSDKLPHYMVPTDFVVMEDIPLTHNGKVDYQALPEIDLNASKETVYVAPETDEERNLCAIWQQVLSLEKVGVEDNFFDIGGHSLLAASVVSLVREALGVEIPMRVLFEKPTIREFVTVLSQFSDDVVMPPIVAVSRDTSLSLSFSQQRLWFIDRLENSSQYHIQASFELHGELVKSAFDAAVATIVQRHEVLRSGIEEQDDQPHVVIHEQVALPITHVDLRHLSGGYQEQEIQRLAALDNQTLFDLSRPPLLRLHLIQCDEQRHVVLSNMHHIASDGWSMGVLVKELNMLYAAYCQGEANPLPPLAVQYADYAHWQREWLQGEVLTQQQGYWKQQLEGAPQLHSLPLDKPRPEQQQYQGKVLTRKLSQAQTGELQSLCQAQDVTLFMFMQTAFAVLLSRLSGETDIVIGSPSSGRVHKDLEGLIGFFINALPLRSDVSGNPAFDELLQVNRRMILDAFEHQHIPFDMLVEELKPQRSLAYAPLAQIYLTIQNNANQDLSLEQLDLQGRGVEVDVVRYDLEFDVFVANEQLVIDWKYNTALFEESTLARMADSFEQMLSGIMQDTRTPVQSLPLLTDTQREQLLHEWNDTGVDIDNVSFVQAFEKQVVNEPDAIAVIADAAQLTYGELNSRANRLAHYLIEQGVSSDIPVALCLSRTPQMLIGLMAILKAGGAYVPIDASYPEERVRYLLADAKVSLVISETAIGGSLPLEGQALMCLDDSGLLERLQQQPESNPGIVVSSGDMAYVIYTSGTTGQPKGVMVTHEGLMNYVSHVGSKYLPQIQGGVVSLPLVFDATVTTLLSPLCHGCFVELLGEGDDALERLEDYLLDDEERLLFKLTPAHLDALWASGRIESNEDIAHVIVIGGEQLTVSTMEKWQGCFPNAVFINEYGPTETVVGCSVFTVTGEGLQGENVPIGKPIQNTQLYCLDEQMQLLPSGVVGELYIGGAGVARGYLGRESLTAERFVDDPFGGKRLYRTGDRVRWRHDGQLAFLGRNDNQVKVRGYRIEPGEIEARLLQHEAVEHAVVIERHQRLQTYLIPSKAQAYPIHALSRMDNDSRWDSVLRKSLPNGMVVGCLNSGETDFTYDEIFIEQTYLKHGVTLKPDATIFDVGANTGMFTLFSSQLCPQAKLFSFEPIPDVFQVLSFNAALYDVDVELCNFGLSDKAQEVTFTFYPYNSLISGRYGDLAEDLSDVKVYLHNQYKEDLAAGRLSSDEFDELLAERLQSVDVPCQLKTLSEVIEAHDVKVIDLLKLDVEKSEMDALKGLKDEHWPLVQQMIVEVHDIENRLEELQVLLADKGFSTHLGQETLLEGSPLYVIYAIRHGYPQGSVVYGEENVTTTKYPWSDKSLLATGLRDSLAQSLPSYMVPDVYLFMDKYPLTVNGKVDTRALPDPQSTNTSQTQFVAPATEIEIQLASIWANILGLVGKQISVSSNFFELGGHSLLAINLITNIKQLFKVVLPVKTIFELNSLADLAQEIEVQQKMVALESSLDEGENTVEIEI